jgi:hypothetical protein
VQRRITPSDSATADHESSGAENKHFDRSAKYHAIADDGRAVVSANLATADATGHDRALDGTTTVRDLLLR